MRLPDAARRLKEELWISWTSHYLLSVTNLTPRIYKKVVSEIKQAHLLKLSLVKLGN